MPAHSPHASMRPACTIDNAGPVRWMSEVSLPTSVAYNAGTLVQHRSVECQRYRCLRALPTSHCDESLPTSHCDESLVTPQNPSSLQCGQLEPSTMLARWCNTGPLNVRGIVAYERCLRAIVMRVRRSDGEGPKSDPVLMCFGTLYMLDGRFTCTL